MNGDKAKSVKKKHFDGAKNIFVNFLHQYSFLALWLGKNKPSFKQVS